MFDALVSTIKGFISSPSSGPALLLSSLLPADATQPSPGNSNSDNTSHGQSAPENPNVFSRLKRRLDDLSRIPTSTQTHDDDVVSPSPFKRLRGDTGLPLVELPANEKVHDVEPLAGAAMGDKVAQMEEEPMDPRQASLMRAQEHFNLGEYDKCVKVCNRATSTWTTPDERADFCLLGLKLAKLLADDGKWESCLQACEVAMRAKNYFDRILVCLYMARAYNMHPDPKLKRYVKEGPRALRRLENMGSTITDRHLWSQLHEAMLPLCEWYGEGKRYGPNERFEKWLTTASEGSRPL